MMIGFKGTSLLNAEFISKLAIVRSILDEANALHDGAFVTGDFVVIKVICASIELLNANINLLAMSVSQVAFTCDAMTDLFKSFQLFLSFSWLLCGVSISVLSIILAISLFNL